MAKTVHHQDLESKWGEEDHLQVAQSRSFSSLIFEMFSEKVPSDSELKVFELILNLSIDHGSDTPSAVKTIEEAKKGETISEAVAEGIEQINNTHGGAMEPAMEYLYDLQQNGTDIQSWVKDQLAQGNRIAGFGHRLYKDVDPRAQLIFQYLRDGGLGAEFIMIINQIEQTIEQEKGSKLPINIDGAIAVALCAFGWSTRLGKAVFIIARTPGLCGQFLNHS